MRDSLVEEKAYSSHFRRGIETRCLLQRLCQLSCNQEMALPGARPAPWTHVGVVSTLEVCKAHRPRVGATEQQKPRFICQTRGLEMNKAFL